MEYNARSSRGLYRKAALSISTTLMLVLRTIHEAMGFAKISLGNYLFREIFNEGPWLLKEREGSLARDEPVTPGVACLTAWTPINGVPRFVKPDFRL